MIVFQFVSKTKQSKTKKQTNKGAGEEEAVEEEEEKKKKKIQRLVFQKIRIGQKSGFTARGSSFSLKFLLPPVPPALVFRPYTPLSSLC